MCFYACVCLCVSILKVCEQKGKGNSTQSVCMRMAGHEPRLSQCRPVALQPFYGGRDPNGSHQSGIIVNACLK